MRNAWVVLGLAVLTGCGRKADCIDNEDMGACSAACTADKSEEACAKGNLVAAEVCAGKRTKAGYHKDRACSDLKTGWFRPH